MKNKIKNIFKILVVIAGCLMFASFSPSLDGRAVVVDEGVFPQGLFAKTVGYLPGDIISVTNIAGDKTIDLLVIGALDPSEGVAIMLSPEAADAMGIDRGANNIVKITKRSGQDERVYGNAVISKSAAEIEDWDDSEYDSIGTEENSDAFEEPEEAEEAAPEEADEFAEEAAEPEENAAAEEIAAAEEEADFEEAPVEDETEEFEEPEVEEEAFDEAEEEAFAEEEAPEESAEETEEAFDEEAEEEFTDEEALDEEALDEEALDEEALPEDEVPVEEAEEEETEEDFAEPEEEAAEEEALDSEELDALPEETEEEPEAEVPAEEAESEDEGVEEEAFDEEMPGELPAEEAAEEETEEPEEESPVEEAFAEDELEALPEEADASEEEYEAIVLVPADSNPPENDSDEVEDVISADEFEEIEENSVYNLSPLESSRDMSEITPSNTISNITPMIDTKHAGNATSYDKYVVPSLKDLESGKYYIQIAAYGSDENILEVINKYGSNYPITIVPMAGGKTKQVLIGPVTIDEYKVVLERFKSYGFKDAFLRKVK